MLIVNNKKTKGLCVAYRCGNKPTGKDRFCSKHSHRYQKENNPVNYTFNFLKNNARRRKKVFDINLCYFRLFCMQTNYIHLKGRYKKAASIDRIDHRKGYEIGNLQVLSLSENGAKGNREREEPALF